MIQLVLQSYLWLIVVGVAMRLGTIRAVHKMAAASKTRAQMRRQRHTSERLCHAMDLACAFYPKRVLCLQRSAATLLLLRRHGWNAELVIGAQMMPFKSHAWVELNGAVVSDKPYMREMYQVLELL